MADQSGHNGHSAESAFARKALLSEEGKHPRLRLSQVHFRLGSRFISVWLLVPAVAVATSTGMLMLVPAAILAWALHAGRASRVGAHS